MTEFRKHDRLRVVDDKRRGVDGLTLKKGQIVTVACVKNDTVVLEGIEHWWFSRRFELVERSVGRDKGGRPLYVGDTVTVTATGTRETKVLGHPVPDGQIPVVVRKGSDIVAGVGGHAHFSNVELVRHHWEPAPAPKPFGPVIQGHELKTGAFMVLKRGSALAWGKVEGWSVSGGSQVQVTLTGDAGAATTYALDDSRDKDPWHVVLHQPLAPEPTEGRVALGFDGTTDDDHPFAAIGYMDEGGMKIYRPRPDVELVQQMEEQIRRWNTMFWGYAVPPQSNHALGNAVDVPVQLNWDDVVIGSVVQVRVRATGEEFTAEVTESPNGTKKGQEPSPHVHGIWTGTSIVRKCWELLRNDLPVKVWVDGSIVRLTHETTGRPELHRIKGSWVAAKTGKVWRDNEVAFHSYEIIRDAEKEN